MLVNFTGSKKQFIDKGYESTYANKVVFILGDVNSSNEEDKATCIFAQGKYFGSYGDMNLASKDYVSGRLFIGTQEEYDTAYNEGKIQVGALVIILDGDEQQSEIIALLGKAILGKMILGTN